jgi:hypothetical protein
LTVKRRTVAAYAAVIFVINILIAGKLFSQEYSDYLSSNEGTFIAIAREIAARPGGILWFPMWDCGLPFQNTYLPLLHMIVGAFSMLTGHSAALAFHQVCATFYCLGPVAVLLLAYIITEQPGTSFFAALAYSIISPSAMLIPAITNDVGGVLRLRRLHVLVGYGEGPPTAALTIFPLAVLFLYLSITRGKMWMKVVAGALMGLTVLTNAFGGTLLGMAALCLLCTIETPRVWRNALNIALIGLLAWCWILPLFPPSVLAAIRMNSPTVGGDFHYTTRTWVALAILAVAFAALAVGLRKLRWKPELQFFGLLAFLIAAIVMPAFFAEIYLLPQPHRYHVAMDMTICIVVVFGVREAARRLPPRAGFALVAVCLLLAALQTRYTVHYARASIHSVPVIEQNAVYKVAKWANDHLQGRRIFVGGAYGFYFNDFTDTPQMTGGHDPMQPNFLMRSAPFQIYSGMGAEADEGNVAVLWMKAFGTRAIYVPGPKSEEFYKPFRNPAKFDGILPVLWHEGGDTIYGVPTRSESLAHVVPEAALVRTMPINGIDLDQVKPYVGALEDPALPNADWQWKDWHSGTLHATVQPGQAISLQITYNPGWHATWNGAAQKIRPDGLDLMVIEPQCKGPCTLDLYYDGGTELKACLAVSIAVMLLSLGLLIRSRGTRDSDLSAVHHA